MRLQTTNYKQFSLSESITFTNPKQANRCLPDDEVDWIHDLCVLQKRATHRFIPGVLETNSKTIYGHSSRGTKLFLFHPHDRKYPPFRVGSASRDLNTNQIGLIEFMDWDEFETLPRGNLLRILGPCGDLGAEREALRYEYSNPKLAKLLFDVQDDDIRSRPLLKGFTFNIDPDGCRDIDDVLSLRNVSESQWEFVITISDVAAHIVDGSEGDRHACQLGETLYQNSEAAVPMLPPALSEMAFSLRPQELHTGISLFCIWNTETGQLTVGEFQETQFKNNQTYTYETVSNATEFPLSILKQIVAFLHGSPTEDSHEWVAEAMLLYNKQVALKLLEHKVGLLRAHEAPDAERLTQFTAIHPDLQYMAYTAAKYVPTADHVIHAGLGSVPYCHASSPIRRYADLVNQRNLKAILKGIPLEPTSPSIAEHLNGIQKQMRAHERSLFFLEHVAQTPSGTVEGFVMSCTEDKTKVYIPSWKHVIRVDAGAYSIGQSMGLEYYVDLSKPHWDQRILFRVMSTEVSANSRLSE
jgi:exoribonuclease R